MGLDQIHEQNNAVIIGAGGAIHLVNKNDENDLRKLPPSTLALENHVKPAAYQAGYLWRESLADFADFALLLYLCGKILIHQLILTYF